MLPRYSSLAVAVVVWHYMWRQKCDVCDVGRVTFVTSLCESKLFLRRSRSSIREMGRPVNRRQIRFVKSHFFRATSSNIFLTILGKNQLAGKFWKSIYKIFWTFSQILKKYFWKEKNCRVRVNQHFSENFFWVSILVPNKIKFDRMEKNHRSYLWPMNSRRDLNKLFS